MSGASGDRRRGAAHALLVGPGSTRRLVLEFVGRAYGSPLLVGRGSMRRLVLHGVGSARGGGPTGGSASCGKACHERVVASVSRTMQCETEKVKQVP